jgi:hypothetical protein
MESGKGGKGRLILAKINLPYEHLTVKILFEITVYNAKDVSDFFSIFFGKRKRLSI